MKEVLNDDIMTARRLKYRLSKLNTIRKLRNRIKHVLLRGTKKELKITFRQALEDSNVAKKIKYMITALRINPKNFHIYKTVHEGNMIHTSGYHFLYYIKDPNAFKQLFNLSKPKEEECIGLYGETLYYYQNEEVRNFLLSKNFQDVNSKDEAGYTYKDYIKR